MSDPATPPRRPEYVAVPAPFFGPLLQGAADLGEVRCALRALFLLHRKRGPLPFVTVEEMAGDPVLRAGAGAAPGTAAREAVARGLDACVRHGVLLRFPVRGESGTVGLYLLDTPGNRRGLARIRSGEAAVPGLPGATSAEDTPAPAGIFALYEANVGPIYPMAAERLKALEEEHPPAWIEDAVREAVRHNRRNLAYIEAILRRWRDHGRGDGEAGRYPGAVPVEELLHRRGGGYGPLAGPRRDD